MGRFLFLWITRHIFFFKNRILEVYKKKNCKCSKYFWSLEFQGNIHDSYHSN